MRIQRLTQGTVIEIGQFPADVIVTPVSYNDAEGVAAVFSLASQANFDRRIEVKKMGNQIAVFNYRHSDQEPLPGWEDAEVIFELDIASLEEDSR